MNFILKVIIFNEYSQNAFHWTFGGVGKQLFHLSGNPGIIAVTNNGKFVSPTALKTD